MDVHKTYYFIIISPIIHSFCLIWPVSYSFRDPSGEPKLMDVVYTGVWKIGVNIWGVYYQYYCYLSTQEKHTNNPDRIICVCVQFVPEILLSIFQGCRNLLLSWWKFPQFINVHNADSPLGVHVQKLQPSSCGNLSPGLHRMRTGSALRSKNSVENINVDL